MSRRPPPRPARKKQRSASPKKRPPEEADGAGSSDGRERLQKVLAAAGVASRRECETLILEGRVEVGREVVTELGTKVDRRTQEIRVDGEPLRKPRLVCYAVHKPPGVVSTASDPAGRMRVIDLVPRTAGRVFNVGRLDVASEGLILVTNDGELANLLTHPRHGVEKTYHVTVAGQVRPDALERLRRGEYLAEGFARVTHVRLKKRHAKSTVLEVVLDEGRNREIRRLLARVGHKVQRLIRVAIGSLRLGTLPPGDVRKLTVDEVKALRRSVGKRPAGRRGSSTGRSTGRGKSAKRPGVRKGQASTNKKQAASKKPSKQGKKPSKKGKKQSTKGAARASRRKGLKR